MTRRVIAKMKRKIDQSMVAIIIGVTSIVKNVIGGSNVVKK